MTARFCRALWFGHPALVLLVLATLACASSVAPITGAEPKQILRVGSTGDYQPFTLFDPGAGVFSGTDIEMARDFAAHANVQLKWVKTTWPNLMSDLAANKFDLAWSGISVTAERAEVAAFSRPYAWGGKQVVLRCEDQDELSSLERLNRPAVRVMVNPGGTNHAFAQEHLGSSTLVINRNNLAIFPLLVAGEADAMVTDSFEAKHQTERHPQLCIGLEGASLEAFEIAVLMPRNSAWLAQLNQWLQRRNARQHSN